MSTKADEGEESFDSGPRGNEHESATERINNSLQKIRSELTDIRDQDLKLLKQLIQISETIKRLSEDRLSKRRTWYGQRQSLCSESAELYLDIEPLTPDLDDYRDAILVRQFSEPVSFSRDDLLDIRPSLSIFDAPVSLDNSMDQSWPPNLSRVQLRHRPHSVSILTSSRSFGMESGQEWMEGSDKSYEEILQRNIRLWKVRHSVHTSDDEDEGTRTPVNDWSFFTTNDRRSSISLAEVNNASDKRKRDSGSSSSSVINSSGSSYGSSAVNGGSSRSSCSSCSSCIFSGANASTGGEKMVSDVPCNSFNDVENIVVTENSSINLMSVSDPADSDLNLSNGAVADGHCSGDVYDFRERKKCTEESAIDERSAWDDGDQTPVIEISEPAIEWRQSDSRERNGEVKSSDKSVERGGGGEEFVTGVPDGKERGALCDIERVGREGSARDGVTQITGGADGIACTSGAGGETENQGEKGLEVGAMEKREGVICMRETGGQMVGEGEKATGGREGGATREEEKERDKHKGKDGAGGSGGDKPKGKESGGGGVVRALWDHIGRKIENRVTVGMAEYSRSFLPVIAEINKKDGRQKSGAHRPRELDIT